MKAFLAAMACIVAIAVGAHFALQALDMGSDIVHASDSVRLGGE
jgi:hypothetical protein